MPRKREGVRETTEAIQKLMQGYSGRNLEKLTMLLYLSQNRTLESVAEELSVSYRTIARWWKMYRYKGIDALLHPEEQDVHGEQYLTLMPLLSDLPESDDLDEWLTKLKHGLERMLHDIDRVSIDVNLDYSPKNAKFLSKRVTEQMVDGKVVVGICSEEETYVQTMIRYGFPAHLYNFHHEVEIRDVSHQLIGTFVFWRERHKSLPSKRTIEFIEDLRPFLKFLLTDCISRCQIKQRETRAFNDIATSIITTTGLRGREIDVFRLLILGQSKREIAESLGISFHSVGKLVTSIHRKTETHSIQTLFQKYLSPLSRIRSERSSLSNKAYM